MNTVKLVSSTVAAAAILMAGAATAAPAADVAKVVNVKGSVVVEAADGVRQMARSGMTLPEGSRLIVLEKAAAELVYNKTQCRINYGQNTLLQVTEVVQCAAGQQIAVGQTAAGASTVVGADTTIVGVAGTVTGAAASGAVAGAGISLMDITLLTGGALLAGAVINASESGS